MSGPDFRRYFAKCFRLERSRVSRAACLSLDSRSNHPVIAAFWATGWLRIRHTVAVTWARWNATTLSLHCTMFRVS